jgi:integrase
MAILTNKLTDKECRNAQPKSADEPASLSDGQGLFLQVTASRKAGNPPARSWIFVYRHPATGKKTRLGLGSLSDVSLAEARALAANQRILLDQGIDPQHERNRAAAAKVVAAKEAAVSDKIAQAHYASFSSYARKYIDSRKADKWNKIHADQWETTLGLKPCKGNFKISKEFGAMSCADIEQEHTMALLEPMWTHTDDQGNIHHCVSANRLRNRIELVLDFWAANNKIKNYTNPAALKLLKNCGLPSPDKIHEVEHHASLPHERVTWCLNQVRNNPQVAARALELAIFIPMRREAIVGAKWGEFDFTTNTWTIPRERMKGKGIKKKEHKTHLSKPVVGMLLHMRSQLENPQPDDYVFPQYRSTWIKPKSIDEDAPYKILKQIDPTVTLHGLRTTFVSWCELPVKPNPQTLEDAKSQVDHKIAKACLAHKNPREEKANEATNAYFRDDFLELRRPVLEAWAKYCEGRQLRLVSNQ